MMPLVIVCNYSIFNNIEGLKNIDEFIIC